MGLSSLITNEDNYNLHKLFGMYVLLHYSFQYVHYFAFGYMILNKWNMIPHIGLHMSSFIFNVLQRRIMNTKMAMFIWEELRMHSMIFSSRACLSIMYPQYRLIFIFTTMMSADLVTYCFGDRSQSTVRGNHLHITKNIFKQLSSQFFSISQLGATIICSGLFQNNYSSILVFSTLPPIQTSAFGMTLIRKNIINKNVWQYVYTAELVLVYVIWYLETQNLLIIPLSVSCYLMRRLGISKYVLFLGLIYIDFVYKKFIHL
jgi:hypothetical protein